MRRPAGRTVILVAAVAAIAGLGLLRIQATGAWFTGRADWSSTYQVQLPLPEPEEPVVPQACVDAGLTEFDEVVTGTDEAEVIDRSDVPGNHLIFGLGGDDTIHGGAGDDCIVAGAGDDHVEAGVGEDVVLGGDADDVLHGDRGEDTIDGGPGADECHGDVGEDTIDCELVEPE